MQISKVNNTLQTENRNAKAKKVKKTPNVKETLAALTAAQTVSAVASLPVGVAAVKGITGAAKNLSAEQVLAYRNAANSVLNSSPLKEAGVKITLGKVRMPRNRIIDKVKEEAIEINMKSAFEGNNAFFIPQTNSIAINMRKLPTAVFHEMGHAHNYNYSKLGKILQKSRGPSMLLASSLLLIAACSKEEKAEDGKELTKGQKIKNGIRKALPAMSFSAMLPTVLEEGLATFKGNKWAKQVLSPELYKKVVKGNFAGLMSYVGKTAAVVLATYAAIKIKDKLVDKKEAKLKAQQEEANAQPNTIGKKQELAKKPSVYYSTTA